MPICSYYNVTAMLAYINGVLFVIIIPHVKILDSGWPRAMD